MNNSLEELMDMTITALKKLGKFCRIPGYYAYRKSTRADLAHLIFERCQPREEKVTPVKHDIPPALSQNVYTRDELHLINITTLKRIAKELGISTIYKYSTSTKNQLENEIYARASGAGIQIPEPELPPPVVKPKKIPPPQTKIAVPDPSKLKSKTVVELKKIAKQENIQLTRLNKSGLVGYIDAEKCSPPDFKCEDDNICDIKSARCVDENMLRSNLSPVDVGKTRIAGTRNIIAAAREQITQYEKAAATKQILEKSNLRQIVITPAEKEIDIIRLDDINKLVKYIKSNNVLKYSGILHRGLLTALF